MRRSTQAAATRRKIVTAAAAQFGAHGFDNVGVADLMSQLGLTHGGFYRHFQNKDQLIAEACEESFNLMNETWPKHIPQHSHQALEFFLTKYLPANYVNDPAEGCAFAMIGSDIARSSDATRNIATTGFKDFLAVIERILPQTDDATLYQEAINIACGVIGALVVARISNDRQLSREVLSHAREEISKSFETKYTPTIFGISTDPPSAGSEPAAYIRAAKHHKSAALMLAQRGQNEPRHNNS